MSGLSPYLRHPLITGKEVLRANIVVTDIVWNQQWAQDAGLDHVEMAYAPRWPISDMLSYLRPEVEDIKINRSAQIGQHDAPVWPKATHGFFRFKHVAQNLVARLN